MASYQAVGMHPDLPGGRKSGTLEVGLLGLKFLYGENQTIDFPIDSQLSISVGGSNNNLIFFSHKNRPNWSVYSEDGAILKEPALQQTDAAKAATKTRRSNKTILYSTLGVMLGLIVLVVLAFTLFYSAMVESVANKVPTSFDSQAGEKLFELVTDNRTLVKDSALLAQINAQVAPLVASVEDTSFKFTFYVMKDPTMNAFALPGGHIVIHTGLLEKAESWNEVLGVLGHEISHVTRRHHIRGVISKMGAFYVLSLFLGDAGAVGSIILQTGAQLESLMYSREFETESDETGWDYLVKAKIHPGGMITFFEKLEKEYGLEEKDKEQQEKLNFLSTHPETGARIKLLKEKVASLENQTQLKKDLGDYASFKTILSEQLK